MEYFGFNGRYTYKGKEEVYEIFHVEGDILTLFKTINCKTDINTIKDKWLKSNLNSPLSAVNIFLFDVTSVTIQKSWLGRKLIFELIYEGRMHNITISDFYFDKDYEDRFITAITDYIDSRDENKKKYYDVFELINQGFYKIDDVKTYLNKKENLIQYDCYINNEIYIDKARMKEAIKKIKCPVYYLDFESYNCPLPRFKGEHPYTQSLFQYSLHVEKALGHCDCIQDHFEYLAKDHQDHRLELIESLIAHIDLTNGGTVIVYNKSFEKTRLKELSFIFKDKKDQLDKINDHIFDLLEVLRGSKELFPNTSRDKPSFTYYNNLMHGSFSIKKVLPLFTNLTYTNLDVKNGTEAILTYGMLPFLTTKEYQEKYVALRIYCRQDTWAMVEILKGIREQMKNKVT